MENKLNRTINEKLYYIIFLSMSFIWFLRDINNPLFCCSWFFWGFMFFIFLYAFFKTLICPLIIIKGDVLVFYSRGLFFKNELNIDSIKLVINKIENGMMVIEFHMSGGELYKIKPYISNKKSVELMIKFIKSHGLNIQVE